MTEENIQKLEALYAESEGLDSILEIVFDNFSFQEIFGRNMQMTPDQISSIGVQELKGPTGEIFKLNYSFNLQCSK